ncbi:lipopolysaccharide biosynthesis protein [Nakamurella leprariae]|uniref:Lipopolysaccharide biosynthesis protein n=1 Tax=Nakamurella leprariae TaxID=2803911 RepID=A0A938YKA9_9ACTN|nr:hypothetical protein [Nakamurella leprariae]MBM9469355.1 hypothetical protein [Nakamurella leprariae]
MSHRDTVDVTEADPPSSTAATADVPPGEPSRPPGRTRPDFAVSSLSLAAASLINGVLGLVFWAAAAHSYTVSEVGRGSAAISTATMLAALANLSLGGMYERFLPVAGRRARPAIAASSALAFALALVLAAGFVLIGPSERILTTPLERWSFPLFVGALSAFALHDNLLVGLHLARWAALKNVVHAVVKLGLVIALGATATGFSIVVAWIVPAAVMAVAVLVWVFGWWLRRPEYAADPDLPPNRELWHFFGSTYGLTVIASLPALVTPLVVVQSLGTEANGYFTMAWTLSSALLLLLGTVVGPFIAEASTDPSRLGPLLRRFVLLMGAVAGGGALFLLVGAPIVLGWLGKDYGQEGRDLTRIMAAGLLLTAVPVLYGALARIHRKLRLAVVLQTVVTIAQITGCLLLVPRLGVPGVGVSYVIAEVAAAMIVAVPLVRWVRESGAFSGHHVGHHTGHHGGRHRLRPGGPAQPVPQSQPVPPGPVPPSQKEA